MISVFLIFNFLWYQPVIKTQKFEEIIDINIQKYKVKTKDDDLEMMVPIQFERPEALSANQ
jgi:hypothetical protein